nr:MAG TPA: hypothetical protein [Caudoviricetes sp.]
MNKTRAEKALEFFEAEMSRGKCFDECPQCNACETYSYCEEYGGLVKENDYCSRIEIKAKRGEGRQ